MSDQEFTGACIVLIVADGDPASAASSQPAHITLAWFGEADQVQGLDEIREAAREYASQADGPITATVGDRGTLGDDDADVVFVDGEGLAAYRAGLVDLEPVRAAVDAVEQHPQWTPHVTLGYPDEPAKADYDEDTVTFDRLGLWLGDEQENFALGGEDDDMADDENISDEEMTEGLKAVGQEPVQWYGVLAPTGVESGDGRMFDPNVIGHRPLPMPFKWQKMDNPGHNDSVVVGNIQGQVEKDGLIYGHGTFAQTPEAAEVIELRAADMIRGVSVDMDMATFEFRTESGRVLTADDDIPPDDDPITQVATSGRVSAATIVPIPAFAEAFFNLGAPPADWPSLQPEAVAASAEFRHYTAEERKKMAEDGHALPDGSFPIADEEDLRNAIQAIGRASDPEKAKAHIKKRANALGLSDLIPDTWSLEDECDTCPGGVVASIDENGHRLLLILNGLVAAGTWGGAGGVGACIHDECEKEATVEVELEDLISGMFCDEHALTAVNDWETKTGHEDVASAARTALEALVAAPGTHDGPGWITNPKATERIRRYWVRGEGALKIKWGVPGDFNRCREQLAKYIQNPAWLAGACANMHKEAILLWPGQEDGKHQAETITASVAPAWTMDALTAAAFTPPREWFENPELIGPTPLTVTKDGRVYGHVATWGTCHIGRGGECVTAPYSNTDYAYFHVGAVETDKGPVAVGHITMETGHADLSLSANSAAAHYDNTATVAADVHAGEDAHGIWIAGAVRPGLSDDDIYALRASAISGDWRRVGAGMEMIAALACNTPGFPVPRIGLAASGEMETALVAAAIVMPEETDLRDSSSERFALVNEVVRQVREYDKREARRSKVKETVSGYNDERRQAVLAAASEE